MPANGTVRRLYEMASSAVRAREAMKSAVKQGLTSQYHRTLREQPEVRLVDPLLAVRRQVKALAQERQRAANPLHVEQLDEAIAQVSEGALMWIDEKLGRSTAPMSDTGATGEAAGDGAE